MWVKKPQSSTGGGVSSLSGLSDVDVSTTAPSNGNFLEYENGKWIPANPSTSGGTTSQWAGKTWNAVGDSITAGTSTTEIYFQYVKAMLGFGTVNNYGVGATNLTSGSGNVPSNPMCTRVASLVSADLITVFGGTNDYGNTPYPTLGDITSSNDSTVYGALHEICQTLITNYPSAKYAFFTPLQRGDKFTASSGVVTAGKGANPSGFTLDDVADAIIKVAAVYSIPVLDLHRISGMQPAFSQHVTQYFNSDMLHPTAVGHQKIAGIIANFLNNL